MTGLSILIYGNPKQGKTWLSLTAPRPTLMLDVEGGSRFVPGVKSVYWHPDRPLPGGDWDVAVVRATDVGSVSSTARFLSTRKHPFRSVVLDSVTDLQRRLSNSLAAPDVPLEQQDWGKILRVMEDCTQRLVDMTSHPTSPVDVVVMTAQLWSRNGTTVPMIKGQLLSTLPSFPDVIGYLYAAATDQIMERKLAIQPVFSGLVAGDRTHVLTSSLGPVITKPNLTTMWETLNRKESNEAK